MKILLLNGSPRPHGNTAAALEEMEKVFAAEGLETELIHVGNRDIRGCAACGRCSELGRCVFDDLVNELAPQIRGLRRPGGGQPGVLRLRQRHPGGSAHPAVLRHLLRQDHEGGGRGGGGLTSTFDQLNKFFTISGMPVASSQYWNGVHGLLPGEAGQDAEGMQIMRTLARNMSFLVKSIALGRARYGLPEREDRQATNFIR